MNLHEASVILAKAIQDYQHRYSTLYKEFSQYKQAYIQEQAERGRNIQAYEKLHDQFRVAVNQYNNLNERYLKIEESFGKAQNTIRVYEEKVVKLEKEQANVPDEIGQLQARIQDLENEIPCNDVADSNVQGDMGFNNADTNEQAVSSKKRPAPDIEGEGVAKIARLRKSSIKAVLSA